MIGAGNEIRTRDLNLGKVALYQLSYSRIILFTLFTMPVYDYLIKLFKTYHVVLCEDQDISTTTDTDVKLKPSFLRFTHL